MVKPNRHELLATTGADGLAGVSALRRHGRNAWVVASDGPAGVLCAGPGSTWRATPAQELVGNPTGAGDALVAALAVGMIVATPWPTGSVRRSGLPALPSWIPLPDILIQRSL